MEVGGQEGDHSRRARYSRIIDHAFGGRVQFLDVDGDGPRLSGGLSELLPLRCLARDQNVGSGPFTVLLKLESEEAGARTVAQLLDAAERERLLYATPLPAGTDFTLRCFGAGRDAIDGRSWLLLEYILGSHLPPQIKGSTPELAKEVARCLARLHSAGLEATWKRSPLGTGWSRSALSGLAPLFAERLPHFVSGFGSDVSNYVIDVTKQLARVFTELLEEWERSKPMRLIHGDARLENVLRAPDASLRLIDWQLASLGEGAFDLAHFLAGSLTIETRRKCEHRVIQAYADELESRGVRADLVDIWQDVRRTMLLTLPLQVVFATTPTELPEVATARREVVRRYATAIDDLRSGDFLG